MKKNIALLVLCFLTTYTFAAETFHGKLKKLPRNLIVVEPKYPEEILEKGIEGTVTVEFSLTPDGHPRNVLVSKSQPAGIFDNAATTAIAEWIFLPEMNNPCVSLNGRSAQDIYFEIKDGKPKFKLSNVRDIKSTLSELEIRNSETEIIPLKTTNDNIGNAPRNPNANLISLSESQPRFELFSSGKIIAKPKPDVMYPLQALREKKKFCSCKY
jgi:TonB family protein